MKKKSLVVYAIVTIFLMAFAVTASGTELFADFNGVGIWKWNGSSWTQVTPNNPQLIVTSGSNLYGSFAGSGIWKWDRTTWAQVTPNNPSFMVASGTDLYCTFTGSGIWKWNGSSWTQVTPNNPQSMLILGADLYGSFAGAGLWKHDGSSWTQVTPNNPQSMVISGANLYGVFTGAGIWKWDSSNWTQVSPSTPDLMVATARGLYGSFTGVGIWKWDSSTWTQVTPNNPQSMLVSGDILYSTFAQGGIWKFTGTTWSQVTSNNPQAAVVSSINLFGAFAGAGVWKWNNSNWAQVTQNDPVSMVVIGPIIADHVAAIASIPRTAIVKAKSTLHIAYGHTSHGSQLITGMDALAAANNLYSWNNGGTGGALDLHDYAMGGDVGYYPAWVNNTRSYLGPPDSTTGRGTTNPDVNVIIWSWCGQASWATEQSIINEYLVPMTQLEADYPGIKFVYMTSHLDGTGSAGNLNIRNQQIRDYCIANNKILFDFADIESYDPYGLVNYLPLNANDNCDYNGGNWATNWVNANPLNELTTLANNCGGCAHSQTLNCVLKGHAIWWLWSRLAGWNGTP